MSPIALAPGSKDRGKAAEERACRHLTARGLRLVERNFRCRRGEIDLIMRDGQELVFVEVRYRKDSRFGSAAESVDRRKQQRIVAAATLYLQRSSGIPPCRFDVLAISADQEEPIEWVRNAFEASA